MLEAEPETLRESALRNSTLEVRASDMPRLTSDLSRLSQQRFSLPGPARPDSVNSTGRTTTLVDGYKGAERALKRMFIADSLETVAVMLHLSITFVVCFLTDDLGLVLDIVGAVGTTSVSYIVPALLFLFLCKPSNAPEESWCLYVMAIATLPYGMFVLVLTLVLTFN